MELSAEGIFSRWKQLIESAPKDWEGRSQDPDVRRWMGQVSALCEIDRTGSDAALLKACLPSFHSHYEREHEPAKNQIWDIIYRQLAKAELNAPNASAGSFVVARSEFEALSAIVGVIERAHTDLLVVDPYLDGQVLTKFIVSAATSTPVRLLADAQHVKPTLKPAVEAWKSQYGANRPIEARLAPPRSLHDRTLILDRSEAYILTQSLNAFATRAHASIARADTDIANLKIPAYEQIWQSATLL